MKPDLSVRPRLVTLVTAAALATAAGCLSPSAEPNADGIRIGVLLPYSGDLAAAGQNLERAVIMANELLAAAEPNRTRFHLVFRDTHSGKDNLGYEAAYDLISRQKVRVVLGPEEPDLADVVERQLLNDQAVAITGGAVGLESASGAGSLFRIVPTAKRMTEALAAQMMTDSVHTLAIIHVQDRYGTEFAQKADAEFSKQLGTTVTRYGLEEGGIGALVRTVASTAPDAVLLVTYPSAGAAILQEWAVLAPTQRFYFAPSLRSEIFAVNVPPDFASPMMGISAGTATDAPNFASAFAARWGGEQPSLTAYYYFDAMLLAGMAYRSAAVLTGSANPDAKDLATALVAVSGPGGGGRIRAWSELATALRDLEAGKDIDYRGTCGPVDFSTDGSVPAGNVQAWTIKGGAIEVIDPNAP
jgi:neutral amino acid transport system substrate-binding protein